MPRLQFQGNTASIDGLTPASIGAATEAVVVAQAQYITALEARVAALEQQQAQFFDRTFDLKINPTT